MATIGITGGTGFIGRYLTSSLTKNGHKVIIFTRDAALRSENSAISYSHFNAIKGICDPDKIAETDAIVHLAGANVAGKRWTDKYKKEIFYSRSKDTQFLVEHILKHGKNCKSFISSSAIGYYGHDIKGHGAFVEDDAADEGWLGQTCLIWENASLPLAGKIRRVVFRTGIVLGRESGAFPKFLMPVRLGIMPIFGTGKQIISWIHIADLISLMGYAIENDHLSGVYNAVSPHPISEYGMMKAIHKEKGGIAIPAPVPSFILKILLGEMSVEILKSCTISAAKTLATGFKYQFPEIENALNDLINK